MSDRRRQGASPRTSVQPARVVAFEVLSAVRDSDAYANLLLPTRLDRARLGTADAALATELTYGTLRMSGYYDRVIEVAAGRGIDSIDPPVLDVLRLGAHQLLSMRVPSHAAVNETVALAAQAIGARTTGFVNAVLRQIDRTSPEEWRLRIAEGIADDDERIGVLSSHPAWIVRAFRQALAAEGAAGAPLRAELDALLAADNAAPAVNLVALPGLASRPPSGHADLYSPYGFTEHGGGDPLQLMHESAGAIRVQDEGSQLAALALVAAAPIATGERWLDLCAGPGGKAALLGAVATEHGASLVANELVPARAGLVRRAVAPLAERGERGSRGVVTVVEGDGRECGTRHPGQFDRVLLDAPCTGLGALRRRPEARWRKRPRDVGELSTLQAELLDSAVAALAPGGVLAYVTCSPHLGESRGAVAGVMRRHGRELEQLPTQELLQHASLTPLDLRGDPLVAQLWPHRHDTDAMFIALLRRR